MPIKSIPYSSFASELVLRSDLKQGTLNGSNKRWNSELFRHEDATRAKLLTNELLRFFCDAIQPLSLIAKDEHDVFFLLTEIHTEQKTYPHLIEKELFSKAINLFLSDEFAIKMTLSYYAETINKRPFMSDVLNRTMLRLILLPAGPLYFFVKTHVKKDQEQSIFTTLSARITALTKNLRQWPDFQTFLCSEEAETERQKCLDALKTFTTHDGALLLSNFSLNTLDEIHALQWQEIRGQSEEDYELSLESNLSTEDESPFLRNTEYEALSPDLPDMTITPKMDSTEASPISIAINNTPTLPLVERTYTPRDLNGDRATPLSCYSFFLAPLTFMRTARGSPMPLIPDNFEAANELSSVLMPTSTRGLECSPI